MKLVTKTMTYSQLVHFVQSANSNVHAVADTLDTETRITFRANGADTVCVIDKRTSRSRDYRLCETPAALIPARGWTAETL